MIRALGRVADGELHPLDRSIESIAPRAIVLGDRGAAILADVAPVGDVAKRVRERCDGVIDRVLVGFPATIDEATASAVVQEMRNNA